MRTPMKSPNKKEGVNPQERIDELIAGITDWRGKVLASVRKAFNDSHPEIAEEWKWMGSPTWSKDGLIAVANAHQGKVKVTFAYGASLPDPDKLFNSGFEGNARRAIDIFEGDKVDARKLKDLVRSAITFNQSKKKKKAPSVTSTKATKATATKRKKASKKKKATKR
jgi:hypothetical protein